MSTTFLRSALLGTLITVVMIAAGPGEVSACIWNPLHKFSPIPPCEVDDQPTSNRLGQLNARIGGKLLTIAAKVREVKAEVNGWMVAYDEALRFEQRLKRVYGNVAVNPIPSLVAEYNRLAPLGRYVRVSQDGGFALSLEPFDIKAIGDSLLMEFEDNLDDIYGSWMLEADRLEHHFLDVGARLEREFQSIRDFQQLTNSVKDSLSVIGTRTAARYDGWGSVDGTAEARVSHLSAVLSRLRGTVYDTQVRSLQARMESVQSASEMRSRLTRMNFSRGSLTGF